MQTEKTTNSPAPACPRACDAPAYCLDQLTPEERQSFAAHLSTCPVCAGTVQAFESVIADLKSLPEETCSPRLADRILAHLPMDSESDQPVFLPRSAVPRILALAATILVLLGLGAVAVKWAAKPERKPCQAGAERPSSTQPPSPARVASDPARARRDAIHWLCQAQESDGGWPSGGQKDHRVGVSALAVLALLDNETHTPRGAGEHAVRRGIACLIRQQDDNGLLGPPVSAGTYNQGLATLALINAYAWESNAAWRIAAERAIGFIVSHQDTSGGWNYLREEPGSVNTSASIWPLMALLRADELGFPALATPIGRGIRWMRTTISQDGLMGYHRVNESPYGYDTLTAAGTVCLLKNKFRPDSPAVATMLSAVRKAAATSPEPLDFYRLFFVSHALNLAQDTSSERIRASMEAGIVALQNQVGAAAGSWTATDQWGTMGGTVYATALAAMSLHQN
jgi:hypothetical protein